MLCHPSLLLAPLTSRDGEVGLGEYACEAPVSTENVAQPREAQPLGSGEGNDTPIASGGAKWLPGEGLVCIWWMCRQWKVRPGGIRKSGLPRGGWGAEPVKRAIPLGGVVARAPRASA